jgi:hypothetical protein
MAKRTRGFSPSGVPEKLDDYHGGCRVFRISPDVASKGVQSVNIVLSFEEALRLSTAIQAGILKLNRYNRSKKAGREMGLCLSLKPDIEALSVIETKLTPSKKSAPDGGGPSA